MKKDYHMHPAVMQHPEHFHSFVNKAIERGIGEICITDHMPLSCSTRIERIPAGSVGEYCKFIREAAKQYEDRIRILVGIEIDYHPEFQSEIDEVLKAGDFDLLLGSSHLHVGPGNPCERYRSHRAYAEASLQNTLRMVRTGRYSILPHMDMYRWIFYRSDVYPLENDGYDLQFVMPLVEEILTEVKKTGMCIEMNSHKAYQKEDPSWIYPAEPILRKALDMNVKLSYGTDAHSADWVGWGWETLKDCPVYGEVLNRVNAE